MEPERSPQNESASVTAESSVRGAQAWAVARREAEARAAEAKAASGSNSGGVNSLLKMLKRGAPAPNEEQKSKNWMLAKKKVAVAVALNGQIQDNRKMYGQATIDLEPETFGKEEDPEHADENNYYIDPDGAFRQSWDVAQALILLYLSLFTPYRVAYSEPAYGVEFWFEFLIDIYFYIDLVLNFFTAYYDDHGRLVPQRPRIIMHYLSRWFWLDALAAIPFDYMTSGAGNLSNVLKFPRLLRLGRIFKYFENAANAGLWRIARIVWMIALLVHWVACAQYSMCDRFAPRGEDGLTRCQQTDFDDSRLWVYVNAVYTALLTLLGDGTWPESEEEQLFAFFVLFLGSFVYAAVFGNVAALVNSLSARENDFRHHLDLINEFMRYFELPDELCSRVRHYFDYVWLRYRNVDTRLDNFTSTLPPTLRDEVLLHVHSHLLVTVPVFRNLEPRVTLSLLRMLETEIYLPGDIVLQCGEPTKGLYLIDRGLCEVLVQSVEEEEATTAAAAATGTKGDSVGPFKSGGGASPVRDPPKDGAGESSGVADPHSMPKGGDFKRGGSGGGKALQQLRRRYSTVGDALERRPTSAVVRRPPPTLPTAAKWRRGSAEPQLESEHLRTSGGSSTAEAADSLSPMAFSAKDFRARPKASRKSSIFWHGASAASVSLGDSLHTEVTSKRSIAQAATNPQLQEGEYFGERSLVLDETLANASVMALTFCEVNVLTRDGFGNFVERYPMLAKEVVESRSIEYWKDPKLASNAKNELRTTIGGLGMTNGDDDDDDELPAFSAMTVRALHKCLHLPHVKWNPYSELKSIVPSLYEKLMETEQDLNPEMKRHSAAPKAPKSFTAPVSEGGLGEEIAGMQEELTTVTSQLKEMTEKARASEQRLKSMEESQERMEQLLVECLAKLN
mmetsp:Transcript_16868/g.55188  ORF Transcript_16868/g.55188 Transcript_16868/m.55188 type:complete len:904 (+) Transcript_16868:89-2800(+)